MDNNSFLFSRIYLSSVRVPGNLHLILHDPEKDLLHSIRTGYGASITTHRHSTCLLFSPLYQVELL